MSFKTREKKRKSRIAGQSAARSVDANRRLHPDRWYLTIVTRNGACNGCGGSLREGAECVYRNRPREILCVNCSQLRRLAPRPSLIWEREMRRRRKSR